MSVNDFKNQIYNSTPAHSEDIMKVIHESQDIEICTEDVGERRKLNTITNTDILRINPQRKFLFRFRKKVNKAEISYRDGR